MVLVGLSAVMLAFTDGCWGCLLKKTQYSIAWSILLIILCSNHFPPSNMSFESRADEALDPPDEAVVVSFSSPVLNS